MNFTIHHKEKKYFALMVGINIILYALFLSGLLPSQHLLTLGLYALAIVGFSFVMHLVLIGQIQGNAIKVTEQQFPDIHEILVAQSQRLGLRSVPALYVLQSGGMLNAFAARFGGRNYIVLYSEVLAVAYQEGRETVEFIIGHELGHIKRKHVSLARTLLLFPARHIPFLGSAYSRACEYTCDNIGYFLCQTDAHKGLLILATGKNLYKKVDVKAFVEAANKESGFAFWFAEKVSSHPHLAKRIAEIEKLQRFNSIKAAGVERDAIDYNNKFDGKELQS